LPKPEHEEAQTVMRALREGHEDALERIYLRYREDFFRWAGRRFKGNRQDFEDAWQETVVVFFEQVRSGYLVEIRTSVRAFLFVVGYRILLKKQRKTKWMFWKEEIDDATAGVEWPEEQYMPEEREKLAASMAALSDPCREILILRYYEEMGIPEIQARLGYNSANTTSATLSRCLKRLKELLTEDKTST
jgi:RNA polymerase sigma factor (sigma-70 family)